MTSMLIMLVMLQAAAAQVQEPGTDRQSLEAVEISGHYRTTIGSSDASSQGAVSGRLIQDIPLLRPGEALETVPGMVVTQHSGDGKANQYFLRGYNLDHGIDFASYVNGVPANMPTNAHGQGYSDVNYMIPELIQRIEYSRARTSCRPATSPRPARPASSTAMRWSRTSSI